MFTRQREILQVCIFFKLNTDNGTVLWHSNVTWNNAIPEVKIFPQVLAISQQQVIIEIRKNNGILWPNLISLDSNTGKELWDITVGASIYNPIFHNNLLLFGASDGNFYALNLTDGTISWKTKVDTQNLFSFANSTAQTFPIQIDSQNQRLFWSFAAKQPSTGNYTGTLCSLDLTNGNMTWTKQIADMGNFAWEVGSAYNDNRVFLTYNSALWIFNASTGDLVQSQQFDHYVLPPIVLGNETFVAADLWLFAYS
jgi:outer membrane protein assembly factor BamB